MSNKQSSIEWLQDKLNNVKPTQFCSIETIKEWVEQAKEMHKQEIINAIDSFYDYKNWSKDLPTKGEQYYKETFVK